MLLLKNASKKIVFTSLLATVFLASCTSTTAKKDDYSGFLGDYSQLEKVELANGTTTMRWISPKLKAGSYSKIFIDPVMVYPAPKDTSQVDAKLVADSAVYLEKAVREQLGGVIKIVDAPEAGALRMKTALTSVETSAEGMKFYEVVPVALVIAGVTTAIGTRDRNIEAFVEVELSDVGSSEVLGRVVKKAIAEEQLENTKVKVGFAQIQPALDAWAVDAVNFVKTSVVK